MDVNILTRSRDIHAPRRARLWWLGLAVDDVDARIEDRGRGWHAGWRRESSAANPAMMPKAASISQVRPTSSLHLLRPARRRRALAEALGLSQRRRRSCADGRSSQTSLRNTGGPDFVGPVQAPRQESDFTPRPSSSSVIITQVELYGSAVRECGAGYDYCRKGRIPCSGCTLTNTDCPLLGLWIKTPSR